MKLKNGRLGRLLITLLLCEQKVLQEPMLYLSLYFKTHRQRGASMPKTVNLFFREPQDSVREETIRYVRLQAQNCTSPMND